MAIEALPDAFRVYLRCHSIFRGQSAKIRRLPKITKLLFHKKESITGLTSEFTIPAIASVASQLLKAQIFESQQLAIQRFPKLVISSTAKAVERSPPQTELLQPKATAAQDAAPERDKAEGKAKSNDRGRDDQVTALVVKGERSSKGSEDAHSGVSDQASQHHAIPELQPVYLPLKTQHILLAALQRMLEECCFDFGLHWLPDLMDDKGWREVESIELTQWTQWFLKSNESLPAAAVRFIEGKSVAEVLSAVSGIRHAAVHRLPTSAEEISDMLGAARSFADMFNDEVKLTGMRQIKNVVDKRVEEIRENHTRMRQELTEQLGEVARHRAALDELENAYIEDYRATDENHRKEAGAAIGAYLDDSQKSPESLHEPENGSMPDAESEAGAILSLLKALQ